MFPGPFSPVSAVIRFAVAGRGLHVCFRPEPRPRNSAPQLYGAVRFGTNDL